MSAGFDAAAGDMLGGCYVTPACYAHMTHLLMSLANGKVAVCLEVIPLYWKCLFYELRKIRTNVLQGGYNFKAISKSALAVTRTLMGEPPDRLSSTTPTKAAVQTVKKVQLQQANYWRTVFPKDLNSNLRRALGAERMHGELSVVSLMRAVPLTEADVIRQYQSNNLYDKHKMVELYIFRDRLSKSFENQVLATQNYHTERPLLVIFHDP